MGQKSSILKLPKAAQQKLRSLYEAGETLDDIHESICDFLAGLNGDWRAPSRSAIHRDRQSFEATAQRMREAREMAQALGKEMEGIADDKTANLLVDMLRTIIFKVLQKGVESDDAFNAQEFMFLGKTLKDVASASAISTRQAREIRADMKTKAAEEVTKVAAERGLTQDTAEAIKKSILGIREDT